MNLDDVLIRLRRSTRGNAERETHGSMDILRGGVGTGEADKRVEIVCRRRRDRRVNGTVYGAFHCRGMKD